MDWLRFLEENNIHFVSRGPNTKRGEVSVHCPLCGEEDPSEHLGINLQTGKWGCLRDDSHRGKSPRTLIKAILSCSGQQAWLIVKQYSHSDPDTLEAALAVLETDAKGADEDLAKQAARQKLGPEFNDFSRIKVRGVTSRFFRYLANRGYENPQDIIDRYDLRCAVTGKYKDRIIIPIRHNDELLGWTSRALIGKPIDAPRYLASSEDVKSTVFNYDKLKGGGDRLVIVEGPFDAIKVDSFVPRRPQDVKATCTFGTSLTIGQLALLRVLVKKFDETWVLFDQGAEGPARNVADWTGARMAHLPSYVDDPGELDDHALTELASPEFNGWFGLTGAGIPWTPTNRFPKRR